MGTSGSSGDEAAGGDAAGVVAAGALVARAEPTPSWRLRALEGPGGGESCRNKYSTR